jgi:hypothetical protein
MPIYNQFAEFRRQRRRRPAVAVFSFRGSPTCAPVSTTGVSIELGSTACLIDEAGIGNEALAV